jgi:hypothetical protein
LTLSSGNYFVPVVYLALFVLAGVILLTDAMHMVGAIGQLLGRFAKMMLVTK